MAKKIKDSKVEEEEKKSTSESDKEIIAEAIANWEITEDMLSEERKLMLADIKFSVGNSDNNYHWTDKNASEARKDRCQLTLNQYPQFINQVVNDARANEPSCKVRPVDSGADKKSAEIFDGLCRNIESVSSANIAYDTALEYAARCGVGYFRMRADYIDYRSFNQDLIIDRVPDPLTVRLDPYYTKSDGSDALWGFVEAVISKEQFKANWPDADVSKWESDTSDWHSDDGVRIVEYMRVVDKPIKLHLLADGTSAFEDELKEGQTSIDSRDSKRCEVEWYKLTSQHILERSVIKISHIPIYPVIGNETYVDGKPVRSGMVRNSKDAQRVINYTESAKIEQLALSPKAPYIGHEGQFKDPKWKYANQRNYPYLEASSVEINGTQAPLPQRQMFTGVPSGWVEARQAAENAMRSTMGMYQASLGANSAESSGRAILAKQKEGDTGTFHYIDNLARAKVRLWRDLIEAIPKYYDVKRIARVLGEDGGSSDVVIDPTSEQALRKVKDNENNIIKIFNPNIGKYDLTVTIGATYATKRLEAAEAQLELSKAIPQIAQVAPDLITRSFDFKGADEIADRLKMTLPAGVAKDDEQDFPPEVQNAIQQVQQTTQAVQEHQQALMQKEQEINAAGDQVKAEFEKLQAEKTLFEANKKLAMTEIQGKLLEVEKNQLVEQNQVKEEQTSEYITQLEAMVQQLSEAINANEDDAENSSVVEKEDVQNEQLATSIAMLTEVVAKLTQPKAKIGKAVRNDDGSVTMEVIEQ